MQYKAVKPKIIYTGTTKMNSAGYIYVFLNIYVHTYVYITITIKKRGYQFEGGT